MSSTEGKSMCAIQACIEINKRRIKAKVKYLYREASDHNMIVVMDVDMRILELFGNFIVPA